MKNKLVLKNKIQILLALFILVSAFTYQQNQRYISLVIKVNK